jgi:hypothetical protein
MFQFNARALLLGLPVICLTPLMLGQGSNASKQKEINVPSIAGEPFFRLKISAEGRQGVVSVRNAQGTEAQRLECPLLRDNVETKQEELAAVGEQFVTQFAALDLDFDRHPDLAGVREFGAKWARYCVWLYDPKQHIFVKDFLAEQMELLTNLSSHDGGLVSSSHIGPTNPWQAVYRIAGATGSRPERQLVPVFSCLLETTPDGEKPTAVIMTRYGGGQAVVQRKEGVNVDMKTALGMCGTATL